MYLQNIDAFLFIVDIILVDLIIKGFANYN